MSLIIGIVGFAGSGKNTVGDTLLREYQFKQDSFAKPLKDVVALLFQWPRELLEGDTAESRDWRETADIWWEEHLNWTQTRFVKQFPRFTPRVCLQLFGTDVFRKSFHDDIWILSLYNRLRNLNCNTVITDCRFPNELIAVKKLGGQVIRVKRGAEPEWYNTALYANRSNCDNSAQHHQKMVESNIHVSEWAWIGYEFDHVLQNDGTLNDLRQNIDQLMKDLIW